jgi:hypothetical protein
MSQANSPKGVASPDDVGHEEETDADKRSTSFPRSGSFAHPVPLLKEQLPKAMTQAGPSASRCAFDIGIRRRGA